VRPPRPLRPLGPSEEAFQEIRRRIESEGAADGDVRHMKTMWIMGFRDPDGFYVEVIWRRPGVSDAQTLKRGEWNTVEPRWSAPEATAKEPRSDARAGSSDVQTWARPAPSPSGSRNARFAPPSGISFELRPFLAVPLVAAQRVPFAAS
jgi:hypothetical protein